MNVSRRTEANYPWIARIDWKNMKIFRKRSTCPSIPVSCPNCANTCSRRPSSLVGKGGHAGQGGRRYRNGTRRKGAPGAEYEQPLFIGHSVGVRALGDGTVGQRGGGVISVHDATRRAKMKADGRLRGRLPWFRARTVFNEPAQFSPSRLRRGRRIFSPLMCEE